MVAHVHKFNVNDGLDGKRRRGEQGIVTFRNEAIRMGILVLNVALEDGIVGFMDDVVELNGVRSQSSNALSKWSNFSA